MLLCEHWVDNDTSERLKISGWGGREGRAAWWRPSRVDNYNRAGRVQGQAFVQPRLGGGSGQERKSKYNVVIS